MLSRRLKPWSVIRLGLVFLILASLGRWLIHSDAVVGMLYGIAIGTMLVGLYLDRRRRSA